jgi:signal transduction histidine kinase
MEPRGDERQGQTEDDPQLDRPGCQPDECETRSRLRREGQDRLSQRLFSIILAVHAAENNVDKNPDLLPAILSLIHTQSAASLDDLRSLGALR